MSNKRPLQTSPSDAPVGKNHKKFQLDSNMEQNNSGDCFSWDAMKGLLKESLEDVAKKDDLNVIKKELDEVKAENLELKKEIKKLNSRIELIDRKTRVTNVVVNGLKSSSTQSAKEEFSQLCTNVLQVDLNIGSTSMLSKKSFMFNLDSNAAVCKVLAAKGKLKGRREYIQRDYTTQEQHTRYQLRQINKKIRNKNSSINVKLGEFNITIDNKKFTWSNNNVIAFSNEDMNYLENLFKQLDCNYTIIVNEKKNTSET